MRTLRSLKDVSTRERENWVVEQCGQRLAGLAPGIVLSRYPAAEGPAGTGSVAVVQELQRLCAGQLHLGNTEKHCGCERILGT